MKPILCSLLAFVLLTNCQPRNKPTATPTENDTNTATTQATNNAVIKGGIYIQTITDYSPQFVTNVQNMASELEVESMLDDLLITARGDSLRFPAAPPIGREIKFQGGEPGNEVTVTVERVNQSTLRYALVIDYGENGTLEMKNLADLNPQYFVNPQNDLDDQSGSSYSIAVFEGSTKECKNSIRIGQSADGNTYLAKLTMDCIDMLIEAENAPVLRGK